jgi:hypothetical protein
MDFQQRAAEIERKRQQRIQRDQDEQTDAVLAQANDIAENVVNSADIRLDQLLQTGATAGQVVTWDAVAGEWVPDDASSLTDPTTTEGDVIYRDGSGLQRLGIGTAGQRLTVNSAETAPEWADVYALRNVLINGDFAIWQRLSGSIIDTADDEYIADRWYVLTETDRIDTGSITGDTRRYAAVLIQVQLAAQRIGMAQIVEGVNCRHLRGQSVTFSFRILCDTTQDVRYAVLEWTDTEDAVTSDVVATWGTTPTWVTNVAPAGSVGSTSVGSTWTDIEHTVTLGSTFNNLVVFIWSGDTVANTDFIRIEAAQLEQGPYKTPFETRPIGMDLALCQRYFQVFNPGNAYFVAYMWAGLNEIYAQTVLLPVQMRAAPTVTDTNPSWSAGFPGTGNSASFYAPAPGAYITTVGTFDVVYETSVMTLSFIYESTPDDFAGASAGDVGRATFGTDYRAYLDGEL